MTKLMLILMLMGTAADLGSTEYALSLGAVEANPPMQNRAVRISSNIAFPIGMYFLLKDHPKAAKIFTVLYVGSRFGVAGYNFYICAKVSW